MMEGNVKDGLDVAFYRSCHADLATFDDDFLVRHYREYGRREGRAPNRDAYVVQLSRPGFSFPSDFDAGVYRMLHPDVDATCLTDWDAYRHYSEKGAVEGRRYREFEPRFYSALYLADRPYDADQAEEHYRAVGQATGLHASRESMLAAHGIKGRRWLAYFSTCEFVTFNQDWLPGPLNEAQALALFLDQGISRLARFSARAQFDAAFHRSLYPSYGSSDAARYREWLSTGFEMGEAGNAPAWLRSIGLSLDHYPRAYAWRSHARSFGGGPHKAAENNRWTTLAALVASPDLAVSEIPLRRWGVNAADRALFLRALGDTRLAADRPDAALDCYRMAAANGGTPPELDRAIGASHHRAWRWQEAFDAFERCHAAGNATRSSICQAAEAASRLGQFENAENVLAMGQPDYAGTPDWQRAVEEMVIRAFEVASGTARTHYREGRRESADAILADAVARTEIWWRRFGDMPAPTGRTARGDGHVVILANMGLRQCTHYRIEQKIELLDRLGREVRVFDERQADAFRAALSGAAIALFYRVPALPSIVRAIAAARAQAVPTIYEVDDLIFDRDLYPDAIERFEGQIDEATHIELMHGVPLYRAAMAMCDRGIASTPALAEHMAKVVRSGEVAVVRNGIDSRSVGLSAPRSKAVRRTEIVRIFYGSATLAHNRDFNELLSGPLCELMALNPEIELVIVGHLRLDPILAPFRNRIRHLPLLSDIRAFWSVLANCDINLATLADTPVNDAKSEIKWLEAGLLGVPSVVSATRTFRECISHGENGFLATTSQDWRDALRALIADPALRRSIGQRAREKAMEHYGPEVGADTLARALRTRGLSAPATSKPRLLLVNVFFPPQAIGGATRVVAGNVDDWLESKAADDFDLAIATCNHEGGPAYAASVGSYRGIPVFRIAPPPAVDDWTPFDAKMGMWFDGVLAAFQPDLVHFHCVQRLTASTLRSCRAADIPYLVTIHDGWWVSDYQFLFDENGTYRTPGDEWLLGSRRGTDLSASIARQATLREELDHAQIVLTPSESFAALLRQVGFSRVLAIANGLPGLPVLPRVPSPSPRVRLGHVGNTTAHKGFVLIEAVLSQNRFANLELVALDHGRPADWRSRLIWGATPVELRGGVAQDEMPRVYSEMDVLLAPSLWHESYGLVTREAHVAGLWVVAGNRGAIGEDIREGMDGFVTDVTNPKSLAAILTKINSNPERFRQPPPQRSLRKAADQAAELIFLYRSLLQDRS